MEAQPCNVEQCLLAPVKEQTRAAQYGLNMGDDATKGAEALKLLHGSDIRALYEILELGELLLQLV